MTLFTLQNAPKNYFNKEIGYILPKNKTDIKNVEEGAAFYNVNTKGIGLNFIAL